jgi:hypothetical protein
MIISSVNSPEVTQEYPRAQKCLPQYRLRKSGKLSNNLLKLLPLIRRITPGDVPKAFGVSRMDAGGVTTEKN